MPNMRLAIAVLLGCAATSALAQDSAPPNVAAALQLQPRR